MITIKNAVVEWNNHHRMIESCRNVCVVTVQLRDAMPASFFPFVRGVVILLVMM